MNLLLIDTNKIHHFKNKKFYGGESCDEVTYCPQDRRFSCEIHACNFSPSKNSVSIKDIRSGKILVFKWVKTDYDSTHEDIYGWRYECEKDGIKYTLLIIND